MHETNAGYKGFNDVDFLQGGDDQQLQIELGKQSQSVLRGIIRAASERLIDHDEAKRARAYFTPLQTKLVGKAGGKDGVRKFFFLSPRFSTRVGIVFMLAIVVAPALAGGENESVAHVGDLGCPATIQFRQADATTKTLNDGFDLQELRFRILAIV